MESLIEAYSRSPRSLQESSADLSSSAPAPLSTSFQMISKDEAVGLYHARHVLTQEISVRKLGSFYSYFIKECGQLNILVCAGLQSGIYWAPVFCHFLLPRQSLLP